ncbi:hypothetical protein VCV18_011411 [Metarhizium anisopliae]
MDLESPFTSSGEISLSDGDEFPDWGSTDEPRPGTHPIGISRNYVPAWTCADAFREFYQNWKDAIVDSFDLDSGTFAPKWRETTNEIQITVHRETSGTYNGPSTEELLGYIRFNRKAGSLELTNFKANLTMHHLKLGGTTKTDHAHNKFAGVHGEGFKLAALIMRRNYLAVRISASSFYWNFGFKGIRQDIFYCRLSKANESSIRKRKEVENRSRESHGVRTVLKSRIWEDVTFKISKPPGDEVHKITEEEFRSWASVAIDLDSPPPNSIIHTDHGDLLIDEGFRGRVYLKGLRTDCLSPGGKKYIFGYNFAEGHIGRDRERLTNAWEEAKMVASIWESAILDSQHQDILQKYTELFGNDEPPLIFLLRKCLYLKRWQKQYGPTCGATPRMHSSMP